MPPPPVWRSELVASSLTARTRSCVRSLPSRAARAWSATKARTPESSRLLKLKAAGSSAGGASGPSNGPGAAWGLR